MSSSVCVEIIPSAVSVVLAFCVSSHVGFSTHGFKKLFTV